jgi:hypothetical protein
MKDGHFSSIKLGKTPDYFINNLRSKSSKSSRLSSGAQKYMQFLPTTNNNENSSPRSNYNKRFNSAYSKLNEANDFLSTDEDEEAEEEQHHLNKNKYK